MIYTYQQLKDMSGQELAFKTSMEEQVKIDNIFLYNVSKIKIRGERGVSIYIDFFDSEEKNLASLTVNMWSELEIFDVVYPGFQVHKVK